jgi:ribosomal protein S18 acetylase RimI-like enzyme
MNAAVRGRHRFEPDEWLSRTSGIAAFSVPQSADPRTAGELLEAAGAAPAFFYAKVPVAEVAVVRQLTAAGFRVVDVNVTMEARPAAQPAANDPLDVREAGAGDEAAVLAIASTCFTYSRFHLDPSIPTGVADRIKRAWVENYFRRRRGEELLVALAGGQPAGFLAVLLDTRAAEPAAVIDLVGVDRAQQARGIGTRLVGAFLARWGSRVPTLRVGTQAANAPSIRLYERMGFRFARAHYVLHAHVREGRIVE